MRNMQKGHLGQGAAQTCLTGATIPDAAIYSQDAVASLRFMIEEEKMAGDLYRSFYDQTGLNVFGRIAQSEDQHMNALIAQANLAGVAVGDLTSLPTGEYSSPTLQALYLELLAAGTVSSEAALQVGKLVEETDIRDLNNASVGIVGTPLANAYAHLEAASEHHLAAFDTWLVF